MATDRYEFPDVREMNWLKRWLLAHKASKTIQMYQDLALASMVVDRDEKKALESLQIAVWWYHRMNALRGVCTYAVEESPRMGQTQSPYVCDECLLLNVNWYDNCPHAQTKTA